MMRVWIRVACLSFGLLGIAVPASAQIVHSVTFGAGIFWPRGFDQRVEGDVLVADLTQPEIPGFGGATSSLEFGLPDRDGPSDFRAYPIFGEWNIAFNERIEVSIGVGYQNKSVDSRYRDLVNTEQNDADILQELRLRMIPITGTVKFLPFGQAGSFQPYVGAGISAVNYNYTETGDFVDPSTLEIFNDKFTANGFAFGALIFGGLRMPLGGDVYALQVEGRWLFGSGNTDGVDEFGQPLFLGTKIDLSGRSLNFGFLIRF
jgi:hypothetical protein